MVILPASKPGSRWGLAELWEGHCLRATACMISWQKPGLWAFIWNNGIVVASFIYMFPVWGLELIIIGQYIWTIKGYIVLAPVSTELPSVTTVDVARLRMRITYSLFPIVELSGQMEGHVVTVTKSYIIIIMDMVVRSLSSCRCLILKDIIWCVSGCQRPLKPLIGYNTAERLIWWLKVE